MVVTRVVVAGVLALLLAPLGCGNMRSADGARDAGGSGGETNAATGAGGSTANGGVTGAADATADDAAGSGGAVGSCGVLGAGGAGGSGGAFGAGGASGENRDAAVESRPPLRMGIAARHRPAASTCAPSVSTWTCPIPGGGTPTSGTKCTVDSDCTASPHGICDFSDIAGCSCRYDIGCSSDSDCHTGGPCGCQGCRPTLVHANVCLEGNCRVDADCGPGGSCSPTYEFGASCMGSYGGIVGYYCHTPNDSCLDDADCEPVMNWPSECRYNPEAGFWSCRATVCTG